MANTVLHESKHILKRVLIGAVTGVSGAVLIYFLGFNKNPKKTSEIEIKNNTIKTWKAFSEMENSKLVKFDSSLVKVNRELITYKDRYRQKDSILKEYYKTDTLIFVKHLSNLEELKQTEDIDIDFAFMLSTRIAYQKEQMNAWMDNKRKLGALLLDTMITEAKRNYEMGEVNKMYNYRIENLIERIGRSIEDLAASLSKKYQYTFSMVDFRFYAFYLTLKKAKSQPAKTPDVAPPDPNKPASDLPD
jgi:hypothetical protein